MVAADKKAGYRRPKEAVPYPSPSPARREKKGSEVNQHEAPLEHGQGLCSGRALLCPCPLSERCQEDRRQQETGYSKAVTSAHASTLKIAALFGAVGKHINCVDYADLSPALFLKQFESSFKTS